MISRSLFVHIITCILVTFVGLKERLNDGETVICAEGYLWELERRGYVKCGCFTPEVVLDYPERVTSLHEEYALAGSDVIEAYTVSVYIVICSIL